MRITLVASALLLGLIATVQEISRRHRQGDLVENLRTATGPEIADRLATSVLRSPDPARARLDRARALVALELLPDPAARPPAAGREARLQWVRDQTRAVYRQRPSAWQAPMLEGAARYLERSLARDPRLITEARAWEQPLETSLALAPGKDEANRFLAAAYLEIWPFLSAEKQAIARDLLRRVMADPGTFSELIEPWLRVADDRATAFSALPESAFAWERLLRTYAADHDWRGYLAALPRAEEVRRSQLEKLLDEARQRRAGGDRRVARQRYFSALTEARPGGGAQPIVQILLREVAPGPAPSGSERTLNAWLDWSLALCAIDRCPFDQPALGRLGVLARDLSPAREAFARAAAGHFDEALFLEERSHSTGSDWSPYFSLKARELARRGRREEARTALLEALPMDPLTRRVRRELSPDSATDSAPLAADWAWEENIARLPMEIFAPCRLAVDLADVPADGAVVELQINGTEAGAFSARANATLRPTEPLGVLEPGLHLVQLSTLAGRPVRPVAARCS
ncbi:MAG: hypothetical protein AAF481_09825 [Acidobacteriota bacterium]